MERKNRILNYFVRATVVLTAVLFLACLGAIVVVNQNTQKEIFWENKKNELSLIAEKCRSDTDAWVQDHAQLLNAMALIFAKNTPSSADDYRDSLHSALELDSDIQLAYIGLESGALYVDSGLGEELDFKTRNWYIEGMKSADTVVFTEPYIDYLTGDLIVTAAKKTTTEQGEQGVVGIDISLENLNAAVGALTISEHADTYLVSADGRVMSYADSGFIPRIENNEAVFTYFDDVLAEVTVLEDVYDYEDKGIHLQHIIDYDGAEKYEATTVIPSTGWTLGVNIPFSDYDDEVNAVVLAQWPLLLLAIVMSLLCLYGAIVFGVRELRRRQTLEHMAFELNKTNKQLESLTNRDSLTGAYNRRYLISYLTEKLSTYVSNRPSCLLMFDLDFFKKVNDQYGHGIGDEVLKETTEVIENTLRSNDILVRLGGEEFIAVVDRVHIDQAFALAERIREKIAETTMAGSVSITVSIGLVEIRQDESVDSLLGRVDVCLYKAKESGRNCTVADEEDMAAK